MIAYHGITRKGRGFFYLPESFFAYLPKDIDKLTVFRIRTNLIKKIGESIKSGRINKTRLEKKGWFVEEIDISENLLDNLNNVLYSGNSKCVFFAALRVFNVAKLEINYIMEVYTRGIDSSEYFEENLYENYFFESSMEEAVHGNKI